MAPQNPPETLQLDEEVPKTLQLDDDEPSTSEEPTEKELPGSTPRLRAAVGSGVAKMRPPTTFESEHTPEGSSAGRFISGLGDFAKKSVSGLVPSDLSKEGLKDWAINAIPGYGEAKGAQDALITGIQKGPMAGIKQFLGGQVGVDPQSLEEKAEHGDTAGILGEVAVPTVGAAAGLDEQAGGHGRAAVGKVGEGVGALADKVARGMPITDAGKLKAAAEQAQVVKKPSMTETEYSQKVTDALPELQRIAQDNKGQIKTPRQAVGGINKRISQIEAPIGHQLETLPDTMNIPAGDVQGKVQQAVQQQLTRKPGLYKPAEVEKAIKSVTDFIGDGDKSLREIEGNRIRLNQDADAYYNTDTAGKRAIDVSDATAVAQRAAANALREVLYGTDAVPGALERAGITATDPATGQPMDIRAVRKSVGRLIDIRDHFEDAITKAEQTGDWKAFGKVFSGPSIAAGGIGTLAGGAIGGIPGALFGTLAGEGAKAWGDYLRSKNPNLNVEKMFRNLERTKQLPGSVDVQTRPTTAPAISPIVGAQQTLPMQAGPLFNQHIGPEPLPSAGAPPAPVNGEQMPLHMPGSPEEAPLFNLPNVNPRNVPDLQRIGGNAPVGAPVGVENESALPTVGGPGREGILQKIGGKEARGAEQRAFTRQEKIDGLDREIAKDKELLRNNPDAPADQRQIVQERIQQNQADLDALNGPDAVQPMRKPGETQKKTLNEPQEAKPYHPIEDGENVGEHEIDEDAGHLGKLRSTNVDNLEVGDTFLDETGDARRVESIDGDKIKTKDGDWRTYLGSVQNIGEINTPESQGKIGARRQGVEGGTENNPEADKFPEIKEPLKGFNPKTGGVMYHGTSDAEFTPRKGSYLYLAPEPEQAGAFALNVHRYGEEPTAHAGVVKLEMKPGKVLNVDEQVLEMIMEGDMNDFDKVAEDAKKQGARYVAHEHPGISVNDENPKDFTAVVSLYPDEDLKPVGRKNIKEPSSSEGAKQEEPTKEDAEVLRSWKPKGRQTMASRMARSIADEIEHPDDADVQTLVSKNDEGRIVSAASLRENPVSNQLYISYIVTNPELLGQGHGTAMVQRIAKIAADKDLGIQFDAVQESEGFWKKLGAKPEEYGWLEWSPEEVKDIAKNGFKKTSAENAKSEERHAKATPERLLKHINDHDWFHVPPGGDQYGNAGKETPSEAYAHRGKFMTSSYRNAEFYGNPDLDPHEANIKNPLVGTEDEIAEELGLPKQKHDASYSWVRDHDRKWALAAAKKGYDAIVTVAPNQWEKFKKTGRLPGDMEIQDLTKLKK